jgi:hypothetical protein
MRRPRFRIRTLMIAVVVAALVLVAILQVQQVQRAWRRPGVYRSNFRITVWPFTIRS